MLQCVEKHGSSDVTAAIFIGRHFFARYPTIFYCTPFYCTPAVAYLSLKHGEKVEHRQPFE